MYFLLYEYTVEVVLFTRNLLDLERDQGRHRHLVITENEVIKERQECTPWVH